ncbi:MAG: dUTP diphosphatase [Candidatus Delongbacteria bacterium]|nr:dUTP diphosphatase [Candidatus Delongbacteria bacterium]
MDQIQPIKVGIKILRPEKTIALPKYMSHHAAGMDICACLDQDYHLESHRVGLIPTGLAVAIPEGYEIQVRPRSGLALNHQIGLLNSPGTIDADYRGELKIILFNFGDQTYGIKHGDRIAQLVISRVFHVDWNVVETLDDTLRNAGGFGHTGKN